MKTFHRGMSVNWKLNAGIKTFYFLFFVVTQVVSAALLPMEICVSRMSSIKYLRVILITMKYVWHGHNWTNLYEWGDSKLNSAQPELHTSPPDIYPCCIYSKIFRWQSKLYDFYILFVGEVLVKCSRRNKQGFRVKEKITVRLGRNPEKKYLVQIVIFIAISKLAVTLGNRNYLILLPYNTWPHKQPNRCCVVLRSLPDCNCYCLL